MAVLTERPAVSMPPMVKRRVALFEPHPAGHGHMLYTSQLARALAQICTGRRFHLLVSPEGADASMRVSGVEIDRVIDVPQPLSGYRSRVLGVADRCLHWGRTDREIVAWVRKHPDIELVHYQDAYGLPTLAGIRALRKLGVKSILTVHNVRPHMLPWWKPVLVKGAVDRMLFRGFDALVVHAEGLKRVLADFLGPQAPTIYVVPHGVGGPLRPGPLAPLEERMGLRRLLFIGAPRPNKGLPVLLRALRFLPDFSLTIAGPAGSDARYGEYIKELVGSLQRDGCRIMARFEFVPEESLDFLLRTHSVVALPYRADFNAQSGVLSQAIAYQIPVVATNLGAVGDTVLQYGLGCLVAPGSPEALAEGVRRLYELNPQALATRLAEAAKALSWDSAAGTLSDVYDAVCG
jgi:glycosyltransferase involved in cell wall biosynthesis